MELLTGGNLQSKVTLEHGLGEYDCKQIIRSLLLSLVDLHAKNIVHLDLQPSNLLFTSSGSLQILDFGHAQQLGDAPSFVDPRTATAFSAPEIVKGMPLSTQADVYSVGKLLQFMSKRTTPRATRQLIAGMTHPCPTVRWTAKEALRHPWLLVDDPSESTIQCSNRTGWKQCR
jgi:serine/threonine protein kinase